MYFASTGSVCFETILYSTFLRYIFRARGCMPNILDKICQSHFSQQSVDWFVFRPRMFDNKQYEKKIYLEYTGGHVHVDDFYDYSSRDYHNLQDNFSIHVLAYLYPCHLL